MWGGEVLKNFPDKILSTSQLKALKYRVICALSDVYWKAIPRVLKSRWQKEWIEYWKSRYWILNTEYWLLNIEYLISGLTLTPPAKTNSHLLLWWSWTLREGRKWPFHLFCLWSQQFVKFNWNALVREKVLNKRWKQFCHQGARCAPRLSDVRRPSTPWPPPRWLHQVGPRVLDM